MDYALRNAQKVAQYWTGDSERFIQSIRIAAEFHDLGKLDEANQNILEQGKQNVALPINHVDAGVAHLKSIRDGLAAVIAYSHHLGLPDFPDEELNPNFLFRDKRNQYNGQWVREISDSKIDQYRSIHKNVFSSHQDNSKPSPTKIDALLFRIALSCLVDADHYDTARHYNEALPFEGPPLRASERLALLDAHVEYLAKTNIDDRTQLRNNVYQACRNADANLGMMACDSPVGTGKTTSVMAHLLRVAAEKGLRRIFVVLPFTNIIDQSVDVYRRALVGLGENEEEVIAAHHHRVEFDEEELRQYSFLWHAPIVVTTAVQFFETLASNHPAILRKLHQLPGSAVFIDEAHAALPPHLWPQAWLWLKELETKWNCHFVLGSGSLNRFWELDEFSNPPIHLPELVSIEARTGASDYETKRIKYERKPERFNLQEIVEWIHSLDGPRLLIVNTVQSAAVIAREIAKRNARQLVEHLSTSLCPRDRKITLNRVKERLSNKSDTDWTLVATSCVEAGVNLSFHIGIRERCSLNSLIQIGGRINRNSEYDDALVWDIELIHDDYLNDHPAFKTSGCILKELFDEGKVYPQSCTEAMRREIRQDELSSISDTILKAERNLQFPVVNDNFHVIDSKTITAIIDEELIENLKAHEKIDPNMIQMLSVQIWYNKESEYALMRINDTSELRIWKLKYDDFLGYMAGVLQVLDHKQKGSIV
jgi:CRISPR-associated endonuclease/helicase Cas3